MMKKIYFMDLDRHEHYVEIPEKWVQHVVCEFKKKGYTVGREAIQLKKLSMRKAS